jgi:tetratricopeptide (TPR) repeat protein
MTNGITKILRGIYTSFLFIPVIVFVLSFIVYFITLAPTYLPPDGAEFALCIQSVGICHPSGFFLYILLGKLFTVVFPFGTLIYKANLLSALYASMTTLFLCLSLLKMGVNKRLTFLLVLIYACGSGMWEFATNAEVFTFGTFLLSVTLYAVIRKRFYVSFLLLGLFVSHFLNSIILLPVFLWYWKKSDGKSTKALLLSCLAYVISFVPFIALLFLRMQQQPPVNWGHVTTIGDFYTYLTRKEFGGIFLSQQGQSTSGFSNFLLQVWAYSKALFLQFGLIIPLIALYVIIKDKLYKNTQVVFLIVSFLLLSGSLMFSLSSLNPNVNVNFQFEKFYLTSFTVLILLLGIGLEKIKDVTVRTYIIPGLLVLILVTMLSVNFPSRNYRDNYFSEQLIHNSLSQLPDNAIAVTVTNQNFFQGWYEQMNTNTYKNITLLYFPNGTNTDYKKYHPELFSDSKNAQPAFSNKTAALVYKAIMDIISKNPDRPVYIWQGVFENGLFLTNSTFAKMLTPYGLWWKVRTTQAATDADIKKSGDLLTGIKYTDINTSHLNSVQHIEDLQAYIQALQSTSFAFIRSEKYDEALHLLTTAGALDNNPNVQKQIAAINGIKTLEPQIKVFVQQKDQKNLLQLASMYYSVRNFSKCIEIFKEILTFDPQNAQMYSNIATMYALDNDKQNALDYYNKALQIDPGLSGALDGKSRVESGL